jgi:hypothetical protein
MNVKTTMPVHTKYHSIFLKAVQYFIPASAVGPFRQALGFIGIACVVAGLYLLWNSRARKDEIAALRAIRQKPSRDRNSQSRG